MPYPIPPVGADPSTWRPEEERPPLTFSIKLPERLLVPAEVRVGWWDASSQAWSEEGIRWVTQKAVCSWLHQLKPCEDCCADAITALLSSGTVESMLRATQHVADILNAVQGIWTLPTIWLVCYRLVCRPVSATETSKPRVFCHPAAYMLLGFKGASYHHLSLQSTS